MSRLTAVSVILSFALFAPVGVMAASTSPNALNGIGVSQSTSTPPAQSTPAPTQPAQSVVVGTLISHLGVTQQDATTAQVMTAPFAHFANIIFALILAISVIAMFLITALDLAYIAVPPIRGLLMPGGIPQQGIPPQQGMQQGNQYGNEHHQPSQGYQYAPKQSFVTQLISDEAKYAASQVTGVQQGVNPMGTYGGQAVPPTMRSILADYAKKRIFFLILFGVCAVLFSVSIFTSIGIDIGGWLLDKLLNVRSAIH